MTVSATVPVDGQLKRQTSLALIYLVPDDMQVSPVYCVMTGNAAAQTFVAAEVGSSDLENLTWSWKPEVGSLTPAGVYTPPAEVDDLQVVLITATSKSGRSGQALVGLLPELPSRIAITPAWVSLSPGQHQQFSAKVVSRAGTAVTWSLLPDVGHIDPKTGAYDPPDSVDRVQPVMVVAKLDADTDVFGVAPILLTPATVGRRSRVGRRQNATPDQHDRKSHGQAIRSDRGHGGGHAG